MLGCSPSTITNYIERHPEIAEAATEIQEERLDIAETVVIRNLGRDDAPALQFKAATYYLRTKGRSRGYSMSLTTREKLELQYDLTRLSPEEKRTLLELLNKAKKP